MRRNLLHRFLYLQFVLYAREQASACSLFVITKRESYIRLAASDIMLCIVILLRSDIVLRTVYRANIISRKPQGFHITFAVNLKNILKKREIYDILIILKQFDKQEFEENII